MDSACLTFSDIPNQKHIVALLRARIIRDDLPSSVVFYGGDLSERRTLATVLCYAVNCNQVTEQGDACGACTGCQGLSYRRKIVIKDHYEPRITFPSDLYIYSLDTYEPGSIPAALEFKLRPPILADKPEYKQALDLLVRIVRSDARDILEKANDFIAQCDYVTATNNITYVLRDLLVFKTGASPHEPSEPFRLLFAVVPSHKVVEALRNLWDTVTAPSKLDEAVAFNILCYFLASTLNPTFELNNIQEPIIDIEDAPMTFEQMEQLILDVIEDNSERQFESDTGGSSRY